MFCAVEIVRYNDDGVEHVVRMDPPKSARHAERVEDGVNRNLNHERFYTRLVPADGEAWTTGADR